MTGPALSAGSPRRTSARRISQSRDMGHEKRGGAPNDAPPRLLAHALSRHQGDAATGDTHVLHSYLRRAQHAARLVATATFGGIMPHTRKLEPDIRCPLEYGLEVFGGKWKSRILCVLSKKQTLRYGQLREEMTNVSDAVLSSSLKELLRDGLVQRRSFDEIPPARGVLAHGARRVRRPDPARHMQVGGTHKPRGDDRRAEAVPGLRLCGREGGAGKDRRTARPRNPQVETSYGQQEQLKFRPISSSIRVSLLS